RFKRGYDYTLFSSALGNAPDAGLCGVFREIYELAIRRFECPVSSVVGHTNRRAAGRGHLPYFPSAGAIGGEVDPASVVRPARYYFGRTIVGQFAKRTAARIHDKNICVARSAGIEGYLLAIRRPAWCPGYGVEVGELERVAAVSAAAPNFVGAAASRFENDHVAVRRILRATLDGGGGKKLFGGEGWVHSLQTHPPDREIHLLTRVPQPVASNGWLGPFLREWQALWLSSISGYLPKPRRPRQPASPTEDNFTAIGSPGQAPSELRARNQQSLVSARNRQCVDGRDAL